MYLLCGCMFVVADVSGYVCCRPVLLCMSIFLELAQEGSRLELATLVSLTQRSSCGTRLAERVRFVIIIPF